ncbi:MAG: GNAT family N-acetyltransferase [Candidatus Thorarchaeota archaeon]
MNSDTIEIVEYSKAYARSIAEHLFEGVSEGTVHSQREELLKPGPEEVYSVCAVSNTHVVGVCTGVRMRWFGSRHRIEMVQVVVSKEFRRQGITRLMMKKIAEHFESLGVEIVQISAESENATAITAYEHIGFQRFGELKDGIKYNGNYSDEILLAIPITDFL